MSEGYDVQAVEAKWQQVWDERGTYQVDDDDPRPKFYDLCMYPYPSGKRTQAIQRPAFSFQRTVGFCATQNPAT